MSALQLSPLQHLVSFSGAVAIAAALFSAAAATAQPAPAPAFSAELATAPAQSQLVAAGAIWRCAGATCTAPRNNSRPAIVCARLAREAGTLASFAVAGTPMDAAALARCNAAAR